jgi:hypothetical protein
MKILQECGSRKIVGFTPEKVSKNPAFLGVLQGRLFLPELGLANPFFSLSFPGHFCGRS